MILFFVFDLLFCDLDISVLINRSIRFADLFFFLCGFDHFRNRFISAIVDSLSYFVILLKILMLVIVAFVF